MGMASALVRRWNALNTDVVQSQQQASDTAGLINACTKSLRMFLQVAVLGLGAWLVLRQELSAGSVVAASIITSRAFASWKQATAARDAWKRLSTLFQLPPFHPPSMPLPRPSGYFTIENVIYAPMGARHPVLSGISLSLVPSEALAIIDRLFDARIYRWPALLVLDEPNSSLDTSGEEALNRAIAAMKARGSQRSWWWHIGHHPWRIWTKSSYCAKARCSWWARERVLAQLSRPRDKKLAVTKLIHTAHDAVPALRTDVSTEPPIRPT